MIKKRSGIVLAAVTALIVAAGSFYYLMTRNRYQKYTDSFFDTFDTVVTVVAYTRNEQEFKSYFGKIHARYQELHRLYDIYNTYPGINNIKTINDNAGVKPVVVSKEIIDLIKFSKDWYNRTGGKTNIAMGPVLRIWHEYRQEGQDDPANAKIPPMEDLLKAKRHTDISKVIVDEEKSTVYLADKEMSLDVGAVAKGFATELVAREMEAEGLKSALISAGGNVRAIGKPLDGRRQRWAVGIQDPAKSILPGDDNLLDIIYITGASVATSGGYQRYHVVDGKILHHLIDPATLMPGDLYRSVTILADDAGVADFMSTTAFLLPYEESRALVESLPGVEALWVMPDGEVRVTPGMKDIMQSHGASGSS
ncbi:MAG TPA: FAD:protein FMN transferase [Firmicutes bacterium]|nr:FAD:protein FMN transferase [Candidatus Fermentithermobacillaceae bacterium]